MKFFSALVICCLVSSPLFAQSTKPRSVRSAARSATTMSGENKLPLKRIILYSNGVAYFERRGSVSGRVEIALPFKLSQIDDVLKSLVVLDLGKGRIGAISYNSSAPPSARLGEIPFSIESSTSDGNEGGLFGVLKQLQGARIAVTDGTRSITGSVLTVEEQTARIAADQPPVVTRTLVVSSETGDIVDFDLKTVRSIKLLDDGTRSDLNSFTAATAATRRRDAKTIVVTSDGDGQREMVVSYTMAAPVWKTSYRVVLDAQGKPFFQGWAIVDNISEEDWTDVSLSLVSGSPISFIQPLQKPFFRHRPVMPLPDDVSDEPQTYADMQGVPGGIPNGIPGGSSGGSGGGIGAGDPALPVPPKLAEPFTTSVSDALLSEDAGILTAATGREVGDLFEYNIEGTVSVPHDRSALIPILQTRLEGERISVFQASSTPADRPLSAIRLKNTSSLTFEGGPMTVFDGDTYAGETILQRLKPGEDQFVTFARDLATRVSVRDLTNRNTDRAKPVFLVRIKDGTFQTHYFRTEKKVYTLVNQTDKSRTVYIEYPLREGWAFTEETPKPSETTADRYRFRVELGPRATVELPVVERQALMDGYGLVALTSDTVELFVERGYLDDPTREAFRKILDLKRRIAEVESRIKSADGEKEEIAQDQARLRDNIETLSKTAEAKLLIARYVAKVTEQETRIEQLRNDKRAAETERGALQQELSSVIRTLTLERTF